MGFAREQYKVGVTFTERRWVSVAHVTVLEEHVKFDSFRDGRDVCNMYLKISSQKLGSFCRKQKIKCQKQK